jgi:hypothetical protein
LLSFGYPQPSRAGSASDTFSNSLDSPSEDSPGLLSAVGDYFHDWFKRVDETSAEQPYWKPPLVTISPLITELYKYDQYWDHLSNGAGNLTVFDAGKGFELIPAKPVERSFALKFVALCAFSSRSLFVHFAPFCGYSDPVIGVYLRPSAVVLRGCLSSIRG